MLKCGGGTDNRSTGMLVQKRLSTKWPLMIILMDYLAFCETEGIGCRLDWRARDTNVEADELTNGIFKSFDLSRRIKVEWENLSFPMIDLLMRFSESFSKRKIQQMDLGAGKKKPKFTKTTWG